MNPLIRFLNFWAGVDNKLLSNCPRHERQKYLSIGVLVLLTGTFAFLAAAYSFWTIFESPVIAIALGALWAFMIINLDRLMLTTFPKSKGFGRQFVHAMPRLILALMIGATIAHPLLLRMFDPEILEQVNEDRDGKRAAKGQERDAAINKIREDERQKKTGLPEYANVEHRRKEREDALVAVNLCDKEASDAERDYKCEADGTCGTHTVGCMSVCTEKRNDYFRKIDACKALRKRVDQAENALEEEDRALSQAAHSLGTSLTEEEEAAERDYRASLNRLESSWKSAFLTRSEALEELTANRPRVAVIRWAVAFLFVLVEVSPIFVKIMAPEDSADRLASKTQSSFEALIPGIAARLASEGGPQHSDDRPAASPDEGLNSGSLSPVRITAAVLVTTIITGGFVATGAPDRAIAAGTLFATVAPWVLYHRRRVTGAH